MASERQIEANRQNARKSTGPKRWASRQRTRQNAYRHGLAAVFYRDLQPEVAEVEELARQFAGASTDPIILQHAREAAHAEFILARIKLLRMAWIQRTYDRGTLAAAAASAVNREIGDWIKREGRTPWKSSPERTMPPPGPERLTEAIRRALPELAKLDRYEARAAARRNRAFRALLRLRKENREEFEQNEPEFR